MSSFVLIADFLEVFVLILLAGLSIWSVQIMVEQSRIQKQEKWFSLQHFKSLIEAKNLAGLRHSCDGHKGMIAGAVLAATSGKREAQAIDRSVASFVKEQRPLQERGLSVLATLGANAPFIGLFGTVLGIIRSFAFLGMQSGNASVMSGISQALIATAVGLFVAIPAVVGYNYFSKRNRDVLLKVESMRDYLISNLN